MAYNLPELQYNSLLQNVAESHAKAMIEQNFYAHKNPNNQLFSTVMDRVNYFSNSNHGFKYIGENIASYDILAVESFFCVKKLNNNRYFYYNCQSKTRIPIYTYKQLAVSVVNGWLNSPSHRENLLDPNYKYLGTAARLSKNPYLSSKAPFARIVQNFGG